MQRVLVLAPRGRDAAVIAGVLVGIGAEAVPFPDLATLATALDESAFAVVVTEEGLIGPALDAVRAWVAGQPNWSDLPFLVLGSQNTRSAARSSLIDALGNAVLLERPLASEALATALRAALRARRRQHQVREEIIAREEAAALLREMNATLERRVAERTEALTLSVARVRAYFESFPEALFIVRVTEGHDFACENVNPKAEQVLGLQASSIVGKSPRAFLPPAIAQISVAECRRAVDLERAHSFSIALPVDGDMLQFDVTVTPLPDATGRITRLLGIARDVTQQRRLEERLHQAQKLEALGQLTGGVAHDFNNLLQVVTSGLSLLERSGGDQPEDRVHRARLIGSMRNAAGRGADLVRRLLAFSRRQVLRPEVIALGPWLERDLRSLLSRTLRGNLTVQIRVAPDLPMVRADPAGLELALLNLALNARDAMPEGGELQIDAELAQPPAGAESRPFVRVSVSDTGTGMTPEVLGRLFEPFFTTKPPGHGTGLGLSQVYGFARQSGGTVEVQSQPGTGTTVSFTLPSAESEPPAVAPKAPPGRAFSILVCEDDDSVAAVVCQMLQQLGHRVHRVSTAAAALARLKTDGGVDLLLTDVIMPGGMDGAALAREAARRRPGLHVLLTTGFQGEADAGDLPLLRKPYQIDDLAGAIARACEKAPAEAQGAAVPKAIRSPA